MSAANEQARGPSDGPRWGFAEFFVISQTVLPALLYLPGTQPLRVLIRVGAFGLSLAALAFYLVQGRKQSRAHPSRPWLVAVLAWIGLMVFHPTTNTLMSGLAQAMLYLAVVAPVFWASHLVRRPEQLDRLLWILLICNGLNAVVGVLQVYDPDRWLPREFSKVIVESSQGVLGYIGADGTRVIRPPGLSDNPGAVCGPGATAALLGLIFAVGRGAAWRRGLAAVLGFSGIAAVYLSQVRTSILIAVGGMAVYAAVLWLQRERARVVALLSAAAIALFAALGFAAYLGGREVVNRFSTLLEDDPGTVYHRSGRGIQLEDHLPTILQEYPLGAGLARWGMMRYYFGDEQNGDSPPMWAELQLPAWALDGGLVLIAVYGAAVFVGAAHELRVATRHPCRVTRSQAAVVLACNVGTVALLFGYTPFTTAVGLQYWFLAGALHGISRTTADGEDVRGG